MSQLYYPVCMPPPPPTRLVADRFTREGKPSPPPPLHYAATTLTPNCLLRTNNKLFCHVIIIIYTHTFVRLKKNATDLVVVTLINYYMSIYTYIYIYIHTSSALEKPYTHHNTILFFYIGTYTIQRLFFTARRK